MAEKLKAAEHRWRLLCAAPPREVFAVMEQMVGTPPYRFEVTGPHSARIVEIERNGPFGNWRRLARLDRDGVQRHDGDGSPIWRRPPRWVTVQATEGDQGTDVLVEASTGLAGPFARLAGGAPPVKRALQVVQLLTRGNQDRRTIYRERHIPPGPISLVASWAGMPYRLFLEPRYGAPRGEAVHTASQIEAVAEIGTFVQVRLPSGAEGFIERDQVVPAPAEASRAAQARIAAIG
ncbi:MAG TPA: hypothetical protein VI316_01390 [Candidatus Dormibacteraeota bacterium]